MNHIVIGILILLPFFGLVTYILLIDEDYRKFFLAFLLALLLAGSVVVGISFLVGAL